MKKMSLLCAIFLLFGAGTALAQAPTYRAAEAGTKNFVSDITANVGDQISLDIYLSNVTAPQQAGGVWIDFSASASIISYVSAGRAVTDGSEGVTGPWLPGVGSLVNEPIGPGSMIIQVANLGGAAPDGDGDLIVANFTLQYNGEGAATLPLDITDLVSLWTPISDADVVPGSILIHQGGGVGCDPPDCDDGIGCTDDTCDAGTCVNAPNDDNCPDDGMFCNGDEICIAGQDCISNGDPCAPEPCDEVNDTCGVPPDCTVETQETDCDDANLCTENLCIGGVCSNPPIDCDDGIGCTDDTCDAGTCVNAPNDDNCPDDGMFCNGDEICIAGQDCISNGDPCAPEPCDEVNDTCGVPPDCTVETQETDCDDANLCTENLCIGGVCSNPPIDCSDGVGCTDDSCDAGTCVNTPNDANCPDDGMFCNGDEICDAGQDCISTGDPCAPEPCDEVNDTCGVPPDCTVETQETDCDDANLCTENLCIGGVCSNPPIDCSDGIGCTDDTCDAGTCVNAPNDDNCPDDGMFCNGDEICIAGQDCISNGDPCAPEPCDEVNDTCGVPPDCTVETQETDCDDANLCTENLCIGGVCSNPPIDCSDGVGCTDDSCDAGTCVNTPNDANCPDDGMFCTGDDFCDPANDCQSTGNPCPPGETCNEESDICESGCECETNDQCDDGIGCTDDSCDGCSCVYTPNDANCPDDGMFCNGDEVCDAGQDCISTGDPCDAGENCDEENDICVAGDEEIVSIDIRPGVCPNPLDIKSEKMLPVAILGSKYFDVKTIDVDSIMITREGIEGGVAPANEGCYEEGSESVVPPTNEGCYKDVGTPFEGELCDCHDLDGDGYVDLTLKFDIQELVDVLMLDHVQGETIPLVITGEFETYKSAGDPISPPPIMMFAGMDCIEVLGNQEVCDNDIDDDYNGDVDCEDADCDGFVFETTECGIGVCSSTGEAICSYGEKVDTCEPGMPTEKPEATCNDGLDNDCDGLTDHGDPDCKTTPPLPVECTKDENCDDGVFCNGAETCLGGSCRPGSAPCTDDGAFCNGDETCDEKADKCVSSGDPCAPESECDELKDICLTEPLPCDITIEPKSPSVVSGQPLTFSINDTGDCDDPAYEWSIESDIGSVIDQNGKYVAGINSDCLEDAVDIIEVMGKNTGAYAETQVKVYCESKSNLAVYPNVLWSSRWIKVPALMFIVSEQGAFNLTSELTFEPVGNISPIWSLGFSNVVVAIVMVETNAQAGPYSVTVTTGSHVVTKQDAVEVFMLPLPLRNRK